MESDDSFHLHLPKGLPLLTLEFLDRIRAAESNVGSMCIEERPPSVAQSNLMAAAFIVTLVDSLHSSVYATFLSLSYSKDLAAKLGVPNLSVSFTLHGSNWKWKRYSLVDSSGLSTNELPVVTTSHHHISCDFDGKAQHRLSLLGAAVLADDITVEEGLRRLVSEKKTSGNDDKVFDRPTAFEKCYRDGPLRFLAISLMACGASTVFFGGSYTDAIFSALAGLIAGFVQLFCSEGIIAGVVSYYITMVVTTHPEHTCFESEILGTLFWFFFGVAFHIALFEITGGQFRVGMARCFFAAFDTFREAIGVAVGALTAASVHGKTPHEVFAKSCKEIDHPSIQSFTGQLFMFATLCVAINTQLRVDIRDWPICFLVQTITQVSLIFCDTQGFGHFVTNLVPSFLATFSTLLILQVRNGNKISQKSRHTLNILGFFFTRCGLGLGRSQLLDALKYSHRDAWFCILPSLYLLVPGSGLLRASLLSIARIIGFEHIGERPNFALIVFWSGLGQVLGVRLGLTMFRNYSCVRGWRRNEEGLP